jgi:hypothetical protein
VVEMNLGNATAHMVVEQSSQVRSDIYARNAV